MLRVQKRFSPRQWIKRVPTNNGSEALFLQLRFQRDMEIDVCHQRGLEYVKGARYAPLTIFHSF